MAAPYPRSRNGLAGGAILVLATTVVLLIVLIMMMGRDGSSTPVGAGQTASPDAGLDGPPSPTNPADWQPLPGDQQPTLGPEPTMSPVDNQPPVTGAESGQVAGEPRAGASAVPRSTAGQSYAFTAVTGNGCAETANAGSFAAFSAGSPPLNLAGGWTGTGCARSAFWSMPMSGDANRDDPGTYVLWWFKTGTVVSGKCAVWLYVPKTDRETDVAGQPTFYEVTGGRGSDTVAATFTIDQTASRGAWAYAGSYTLQGGQIGIKLRNRGAGTGGARHAAAQAQVGCG